MTYVGAIPTTGDFKLLDSITTSSATTFNLRQGGVAVYPQSANHCIVQLNGVNQVPTSSFNIVNDTIVFASSLSSDDVINQILVLGNVNDIGVPSDDTVSTAKIQADAINSSLIADDSISDEHLDITAITGQTEKTSLVDADKFLISDSAASGALKYVQKSNLGAGGLTLISSQKTYQANATALDFQNVFSDTYDMYVVDVIGWRPTTADRDLSFRFRVASSGLISSGYAYAMTDLDQDNNASTRTSASASQGFIFAGATENSMSGFARCYVPRPQGMGSYKPRLFGTGANIQNSGSDLTSDRFAIKLDNTNALTGIYFFNHDGSEIYGLQVKIYGVV